MSNTPSAQGATEITKSKRNNTLDLLRGHFLLAILITHYYKFPSPYVFYFGRGELWVSSAPGFVFISGLVIGMISRKKMLSDGIRPAISRVFKRGFKLYILSVLFTVSYTIAALEIGRWQVLNYGILQEDYLTVIWKTMLLQYSYGWADLLLYYSVMLMFVAPIVLFAIHKGFWKILLAISTAIWLGFYVWPGDQRLTGSYLPVESWQFLFVLAMLCGYFKEHVAKVYRKYFYGENKRNFLVIFFSVVFVTIALSIADRFYNAFDGNLGWYLDRAFYKREFAPGLLVMFFLWFTALYYLFQRFEGLITRFLGWLYLPFGRNSLLTYSVQSVFLFIQFYLPIKISYWWNTFSTTALILVVWAAVMVLLKLEQFYKTSKLLPEKA